MCRARKFHLIGSLYEQCVSDPPPAPVWPNPVDSFYPCAFNYRELDIDLLPLNLIELNLLSLEQRYSYLSAFPIMGRDGGMR